MGASDELSSSEPSFVDSLSTLDMGAAPPSLKLGARLRHYEIIRSLGRGGMGKVYLARDVRLGRLVALKFLSESSPERTRRFILEARATAQLAHENIVNLHDIGEHEGAPYMALEYIKGQTLKEWLRDRAHRSAGQRSGEDRPFRASVPPRRAVELMLPVVRALVHAQAAGIVHSDLKPANIMLADSGAVKVLDFGIAKLLRQVPEPAISSRRPELLRRASEPSLTRTDAMMGTMPYMSPEQWGADTVDHRSDLWAVGIMLYELVLGHHPLSPTTAGKLVEVASLDVPMPSAREELPDLGKLAAIIDGCLVKRKEDRIGSARELLDELEAVISLARRSVAEGVCPYAGLAAFQESEAERFFGRDQAVTQALARLRDAPLLAVVGPSGAGKSSFVRAGVIPALKRGGDAWEAFVIRPGPRPLAALAELLLKGSWQSTSQPDELSPGDSGGEPKAPSQREAMCELLQAEPGYLGAMLRARARRKSECLLLFVDQLEEAFTLTGEAEREAFFRCLAGAADDAWSPIRVILSMRADFLERMAMTQTPLLDLVSRGILLLRPMDRPGLRQALVEPAEAAEYRFESEALVERMLDELMGATGALPLLQFTAARLWEERDVGRRLLTEASYERTGGVAGALASHADLVLAGMTSAERRRARSLLLRLVTPERTRAMVPLSELRSLDEAAEVDRLVNARLLTVEGGDEGGAGTVELAHESLVDTWPMLRRWLDESEGDAAFLARLRSAATEWERGGRAEGLLWRGEAAHEAVRWYQRQLAEPRIDLARREEEYLIAVQGQIERSHRTRRRAWAGAFIALALVAVGALTMSSQLELAKRDAEKEAMRARDEARMATLFRFSGESSFSDATTRLGLLREIESSTPSQEWTIQARLALLEPIARVILIGHGGAVSSVAFSPDSRLVASGSVDGTVRVWNADGSGGSVVLSGHEENVVVVAFSPDGRRIVSGSRDGSMRVWNADGSGAPLVLVHGLGEARGVPPGRSGPRDVAPGPGEARDVPPGISGLPAPRPPPSGSRALHLPASEDRRVVRHAAFSPDGQRILYLLGDGSAHLSNADGTGLSRALSGPAAPVSHASFSPDGRRILLGFHGGMLRIEDTDGSGEPVLLPGQPEAVLTAAFSPDGDRVVSGSTDGKVRVWNTASPDQPLVLSGHRDMVIQASFSPDGRRILTSSLDRTLRVWNTASPGQPLVLSGHQAGLSVAMFSGDGDHVISSGTDGKVRVFSASGPGEPLVLSGHDSAIFSMALSPDGKLIASASDDRTVRIWSAETPGLRGVLRGHSGLVTHVAFSPDGTLAASSSQDGAIRLWHDDGACRILDGDGARMRPFAFTPDGGRLVSVADGARIVVRDIGSGDVLHSIPFGSWSPTAVAVSPDGARIAVAGRDGPLTIARADGTGAPLALQSPVSWIHQIAWSPDGARVAAAVENGAVWLWSADGAGEPRIIEGHKNAVWSVSFHPDGTRLAFAGDDNSVVIVRLDGAGEPLVLRGYADRLRAVAYSPDGKQLLTACLDGLVQLRSADGSGDPVLVGYHQGGVHSAAFDCSGARVISGGADKTVRIWSDFERLEPGSPRLWQATSHCLPVELLERRLGLGADTARAGHEACLRRVSRARELR